MRYKVVGIGEALWDLLPTGPQLGGAPANFACHAGQLGARGAVITRVGNDAAGDRILERYDEMGLDRNAVQRDGRLPTGSARVTLDPAGVPQFIINDSAAWDNLQSSEEALAAVQGADAICFGTLAQRRPAAADAIQQLVTAAPGPSLRVLDLNLRQGFYHRRTVERSLQSATVLKLNEQELATLSAMYGMSGDADECVGQLVRRFALRVVALTCGANGSVLYQDGARSELPGRQTTVVDTVGAGDAFAAGLIMGLLHRFELIEIHRIAADIAGFVCSQPGATPKLPAPLRTAFDPLIPALKS